MITRIDIKNLRSFDGQHSFALAPITLIYGPNSSGKSTLLQTLGVLKQTLRPVGGLRQAEALPLVLEGDIVDLGTFTNAVHKHELDRELFFGLTFEKADGRGTYAGLGFSHSTEPAGGAIQTVAAFGDEDMRVHFKRSSDSGRFSVKDADHGHFLSQLADHLENDPSTLGQAALAELRENLASGRVLEFIANGLFPALPVPNYLANLEADMKFGNWFETSTYERIEALDHLLVNLSYLGPVRAAPSRFQVLTPIGAGENAHVGTHGEHATRLLLENRNGILNDVNRWLERLDIPYSLSVHQVRNAAIGTDIGDLVATVLKDRGDTEVTPQDVGFGISQVLPVVVESLTGAGSTICIEQPEIHIHPRLQGDLADLFLESAMNGNQLIIETHSESLILRLLRRLRQSMDGWLTEEMITVIYVGSDALGRAVPKQITVNDDGHFNDSWPDGFFDERYADLWAE